MISLDMFRKVVAGMSSLEKESRQPDEGFEHPGSERGVVFRTAGT